MVLPLVFSLTRLHPLWPPEQSFQNASQILLHPSLKLSLGSPQHEEVEPKIFYDPKPIYLSLWFAATSLLAYTLPMPDRMQVLVRPSCLYSC